MSFQSSPYYNSVKNVQIYEDLDKTVGLVKIEHLDNGETRIKILLLNLRTITKNILKSKMTVQEEVSSILREGKVFIQFPLASVIGSQKRNPDKYNNLLAYYMPSSSTTQQSLLFHIDGYNDMILD
jgi:hypothetical protein